MKFLVPNYKLPPEPLTRGLPPPDPHSLSPLSSTEFVEPPPEKNSWLCHWYIECDVFHFHGMYLNGICGNKINK